MMHSWWRKIIQRRQVYHLTCEGGGERKGKERKQKKKSGFVGRKPASSLAAEGSGRNKPACCVGGPETRRSCRSGQRQALLPATLISSSIPGEGSGPHAKSHNFMRVVVSLPPGIMRDRALAERDLVTFPEIFFFSVLSNRCRATWEAGSLDGFEELSVLSTHSLRPFIWSKCSEKLPTVQRRRDKHVQETLG